MTYRIVCYDILKSLNAVFDDADIRINQVLYWVLVDVNRLIVDQYRKTQTGQFLSTFSPVAVSRDEKGRQYFDLPMIIVDLPNERGIDYITYNEETGCCCDGDTFSQIFFQPTTPSKSHRLYRDEYEKPSSKNPYFYRVGNMHNGVKVNRIYLIGTDCIELKDVEIALITTLDPKTICNLDEEIPLPNERIEEVMKNVLEIGRFVMMMPKERTNDGSQEEASNIQAPSPQTVQTDQNQQ